MTATLRITRRTALLVVLFFVLLWSALALPVFSGLRTPMLEKILSEQIGQTVYIEGDVSIILSATSHVRATKVVVPSETIENVNLAVLEVLELELDLLALISGHINIDNLNIDGLNVQLLTDTDVTFCLTAGGHNSGVLSEPGHRNRHYRLQKKTEGEHHVSADTWMKRAELVQGSWWPAWVDWLEAHSGTQRPARQKVRRPIGPAPGTYVFG